MSSSTSESALLRDGTTIAAEISELRLVPKTWEQYNSSIRNFNVWIKEKHDVFFEETSRELILPLPKEVILQYMGEISIHKKLKNADGSEKSVSSSLICSFRSSLVCRTEWVHSTGAKICLVTAKNLQKSHWLFTLN